MVHEVIAIHRGRNRTTSLLVAAATSKDYNFDFRGVSGGSKFDPLWLLLKAWITAKEIPEAKAYLIEGGMLFWVGYFLKKKFPRSKMYLIVPEPAYFDDPRKNFLKKIFFNFRIRKMKENVDLLLPNSMMIHRDAIRLYGENCKFQLLRYPTQTFDRVIFQSDKSVMFVIERPDDTGYMKGYDKALRVFEAVRSLEPGAKLFLVGLGTESLTNSNKNIFGCGRMVMSEAFKLASVIIAPARYDAFLMAIPEAASAGLIPIVSTQVGSQDLFPEYHKKFILNCDDEDLWVQRVIESFSLTREYRDRIHQDFVNVLRGYQTENLILELKEILARI